LYTNMGMKRAALGLLGVLGVGCSDAATTATAVDGGGVEAAVDAAAPRDGDTAAGLRDQRYCEVLAGNIVGGNVQLDVYNTIGLNECPDAAWRMLSVPALRTELGVQVVVLNGPRHWTLDAFETAMLQNPTTRVIGGLAMRIGGRIELPLATAMAGSAPYRIQTVRRDSTVRFNAGGRVHELIDDMSNVYVMQSYSLQTQMQTLASLETLGARIMPPAGWSYRTRVLTADLRVTAVDGFASVTTDNFGNTYQRTQLRP